MGAYLLVDTFAPLLVARRVGVAETSSVVELLAWVDAHLVGDTPRFALVYDGGRDSAGQPGAEARAYAGEWLTRTRAKLARTCVGIDFSVSSAIGRGALTAVFWVAKPPVPFAIHANIDEALAAAVARLADPSAIDPSAVKRALAGR